MYQKNDDKLDDFNYETKMEVYVDEDRCKILLEKDNPPKTQYWFDSTIIENENYIENYID